ncbi:pyridoxamine 5'-phosphate oxidase family protein [Phytohabitans houttuyneae]|uniref:Pyridoxamine 5'-phosphate oxidase n=1 Tax=Phytohabitans houttuyneae TaxID=1076126 RepID=A0A6V8KPR0_9ACTN|nr:pyridoxamine 5'-phosphate oxidase family protein [Phytohabitans houttuyneae]GFJ84209.1 pyridoxamine 5'-phosphate oxidase [Phytohabitans houttuyneae]
MSALNERDREFLRRPRLGFLTVPGRDGDPVPAPRPVWFEVAGDGTFQIFSGAGSPKVRRLRARPRASLVAANEVGEPEYWVSVTGPVTVSPDGGAELASRLADRYWDLSDPALAAVLDGMLRDELVRIVIHPETVRRYG